MSVSLSPSFCPSFLPPHPFFRFSLLHFLFSSRQSYNKGPPDFRLLFDEELLKETVKQQMAEERQKTEQQYRNDPFHQLPSEHRETALLYATQLNNLHNDPLMLKDVGESRALSV
jgi:hypothetical protein